MIPTEILFSPLAIAGFVTGVVVAFPGGTRPQGSGTRDRDVRRRQRDRARRPRRGRTPSAAAALFAAAAVGFGASLWAIGNERSRRPTIR